MFRTHELCTEWQYSKCEYRYAVHPLERRVKWLIIICTELRRVKDIWPGWDSKPSPSDRQAATLTIGLARLGFPVEILNGNQK